MTFSCWHRTPLGGYRRVGVFDTSDEARSAGSRVVADLGGAAQVFPLGRSRSVMEAVELWPHDGTVLAPPASADVAQLRRTLAPRERVECGTVAELDYFGDAAAQ